MHAFLQAFFNTPVGREDRARRAVRLLTFSFLGLLWVIFALWAFSHRNETAESSAVSLDQQRLAAELEFRGDLKPVQVFLLLANRWIADNPGRDPRGDPIFADMARQFQAATRSSLICLVDKHGTATAISPRQAHGPKDITKEEYFLGALSQGPGRIHLGKPYLDQDDQQWKLPVSFTLTQKAGPLSILVAHLELAPLLVSLSERAATLDSRIMIFRRDGILLAETPSEPWRIGQSFASTSIFQQGIHLDKNAGLLKDQTTPEGPAWVAFGGTTEFPVVAAISQESRLVFREWRNEFWTLLALLLAASVLTLIMARRAIVLLEDLEESRESLRVMAMTDSLTGLYNRRHFYDLAETEWERALRYNRPLSLIIVDIDLFKLVNDTHGHAIGDEVLKNVANSCRAMLRDHDVMCRLGGEEFSIMLPETSLEGAMLLAERLRIAIGAMVTPVGSQHVAVTISAGVAQTNGDDEGFNTLEHRADNALYRAKESGRNRVCQG